MAGSGAGWFRWVGLALLIVATGLSAGLTYTVSGLALVVLATGAFGLGYHVGGRDPGPPTAGRWGARAVRRHRRPRPATSPPPLLPPPPGGAAAARHALACATPGLTRIAPATGGRDA